MFNSSIGGAHNLSLSLIRVNELRTRTPSETPPRSPVPPGCYRRDGPAVLPIVGCALKSGECRAALPTRRFQLLRRADRAPELQFLPEEYPSTTKTGPPAAELAFGRTGFRLGPCNSPRVRPARRRRSSFGNALLQP